MKNTVLAIAQVAFVLTTWSRVGWAQASVTMPVQPVNSHVSRMVATGINLGPAEVSQTIDLTVWLQIHNRAGLDALTAQLYDPTSPKYRQFLTHSEFLAQYGPTAAEAAAVQRYLASQGLSVFAVDPSNLFVRARGTVGVVSAAFQTQINNFSFKGQTYFANTTEPQLSGSIASLVAAISGLQSLTYEHPYKAQRSLAGGSGNSLQALPSGGSSSFFNQVCFTGAKTEIFNTGSYPVATYSGNLYGGALSSGCGYTPPEIQKAYNLNALYKEGFDGTGQTIVIIDWCGSPTIRQDANAFSQMFGLPPLTPANFRILNSTAPPACSSPDPEINIDVEWAHAIAPGAKIALVVPPSPSFQDVDLAELYAIGHGLGNVISGSYGSEEYFTPLADQQVENLINELAAVEGISANFSSGDGGDFTLDLPGQPASVIAPANSPYATAVGGVSLALNASGSIAWQTGWGNNESALVESGYVFDPPTSTTIFNGGAGGGPSAVYAKPPYQNALPGTFRQLPDISWLADPFTGGAILISEPFQIPSQIWTVYGGTSLACPMFSALWAIANQAAGRPLGLAAPYLYSMPKGAITDVLPLTSSTNVTGSLNEGQGKVKYFSADQLAAPLEGTTQYLSAIWNVPLYQDTAILLTFGTDSGLKVTPGWDNVTGLGTPNGKTFVDYFKP